jgi:hypothetical protein
VARDHGGGFAQCVEQADHIANQMEQGVLVDLLGAIGLPIAAHVRRDGVKSRVGERVQLMAPGIPGLRESVTHQYQWAGTALGDMHADSVGF